MVVTVLAPELLTAMLSSLIELLSPRNGLILHTFFIFEYHLFSHWVSNLG